MELLGLLCVSVLLCFIDLTVYVERFPGQENTGTVCKIPTIIYYDKSGKVRAVGAEAIYGGINLEAEENEWVKAEWFIRVLKLISFTYK
jgi:hypothetical protein